MPIEDQYIFINSEIKKHQDAISALDAIKATLTDKAAVQVASIDGLNAVIVEKDRDILALQTSIGGMISKATETVTP